MEAARIEIQVPSVGREPPKIFKATSDLDGEITIASLPLGIFAVRGPEKDGYLCDVSSSPNLPFGTTGYGNVGMSPDNPRVWRLWKQRGPLQPVINENIVVECASDGTKVPIDLLMDHPGAPIEVWQPKIPAGKPVDLKVSIDAARQMTSTG